MQGKRILLVDDDKDILFAGSLLLRQEKFMVDTAERPDIALDLCKRNTYDLAMLDMNFRSAVYNGNEGLLLLREIHKTNPDLPVIMITAYAEIEIAVQAIKAGAVDFITKPWRNEILLEKVQNAIRLQRRNHTSVKNQQPEKASLQLEGRDPAFLKIKEAAEKVASSEANILITGENGTGKDLLAQFIHLNSWRRNKSFIKVDMGAIPATLFESEMFGHKKGAFTDAKEDREGKFSAADGGTLFLDEIGNLTADLQVKLLNAIQAKKIVKVGSNTETDINVRIISATNARLEEMVADKRFRQDLLYRLNTVVLHMPALRERREDIILLAKFFLQHYTEKYQKPVMTLTAAAEKKLVRYDWPGNIRELQHALERAVILSEETALTEDDFVLNENTYHYDMHEPVQLSEMEKDVIRKTLLKHAGNISRAARELGLSRAALYRRIEKHDI